MEDSGQERLPTAPQWERGKPVVSCPLASSTGIGVPDPDTGIQDKGAILGTPDVPGLGTVQTLDRPSDDTGGLSTPPEALAEPATHMDTGGVLTPPGAFAEAHSVGARVAPDVSLEDCVQFLVQQVQGLHARTDTQRSILVHHLQCAQQQQAQAIHQTQLKLQHVQQQLAATLGQQQLLIQQMQLLQIQQQTASTLSGPGRAQQSSEYTDTGVHGAEAMGQTAQPQTGPTAGS